MDSLTGNIQAAILAAQIGHPNQFFFEKTVETLFAFAVFSDLATECKVPGLVEDYVKDNKGKGIWFLHKEEGREFYIASSFTNSLKFREHVAKISSC